MKDDGVNETMDASLLLYVLNSCPPLAELLQCASKEEFKAKLDAINKLLLPLLTWLITSNRSHVRKLTESERCAGGPKHQFVLLTSDPSREKYFQVPFLQSKSCFSLKMSLFG